jgi:hypothetical protein
MEDQKQRCTLDTFNSHEKVLILMKRIIHSLDLHIRKGTISDAPKLIALPKIDIKISLPNHNEGQ